MTIQRTVLVIAGSAGGDVTYQQQLQQDRDMAYNILLEHSGATFPSLSQFPAKLDGILLELESPHNRGLQLLRQLQEQTSAPVIVVDGGDTKVAVQAFRNGAADYLVKNQATPDDVRLAMRTAIENAELKRELQRSQEAFYTSVENMLDCFGTFSAMRDESGRIVDFRIDYLNAAACESNQMPKAMQIGRALCELLPAHRETGLFDEYCRVVETGEPLIKESLVYDDTYGDRRLVRAFDIRATKLNDGFVASWRDVTDRKRLELEQQQTNLELQKSQERLNLAMSAASMGSWDWNIQTGEVRWSTNLERLFGMAPGSFDGRYETVRTMIHPEDLPRVEAAIQRALYDDEAYNIEFRFIKPDGTVRWALGLGRVFHDDDGNPVMMAGVDRDITTRKQTEAALRSSERRYRSLVEATAQIIWNTEGNQGEFTTEQPSWSAFTGQTFDQLKGWGWLDAVHPDDRAKTTQACSKALESRAPCEVEYRLRRQDGVYRHMHVRAVPVFEDNGTVLEWLGVHTDITDAKQAAVTLAANEARLRGFVESNVVGIIYGDIYGNINAANDELLRIVGYTQDDVRAGRLRWVDITPPEYLPLDETGIAEARARGACTPYEKEYIRKDGSRVPVLIGYSLLGEAKEESVVFVLDLSDRKQAEQALQASEERFRQLAENIDLVFWVKELPGNHVSYVSPAYQRLWGLEPQHVYEAPHGWLDYIYAEDRDTVARAFAEKGTTGEFDQEYRIVAADGTVRWVRDRCFPLRDEAGNTFRLAGITEDITDRRQTELRLQESEARLQLGMQVTGSALVQIDYPTNTVNLSPEAAALYGLPADQLTISREQFHATFHPEDRAHLEQRIQEILDPSGSGWFAQDHRVLWPNDEVKWLTVRKQVFFDQSNSAPQPNHAILVALDITDRKQTEQTLQENVLRFRTMADNISQLAWMANEAGSIFWYNQRWFDFTGTTLDDMQGWGWQTVHHPDHVERVVEKISQCFATGEVWEDTFPLRSKTGEYRWFLSRAIPIRDDQGRVLRWFGTNTDITKLRETENALRQSEERYRCLADSIPQLVWTANGEGMLLDVNQRWTAFTGLTLEQARTDGWEAVVHPEDIPVLTQQWTEAAQRGTPYQAEGRMRQADGSYRWFLHQAIPQRNEQGQIVQWFGTATDIDMQKQLELERNRLLQQEQAAREAAERANRIKDEFLAVLSHELRSPLNPILGWARLLQSRQFDAAKTAEALATIERNAKLQTQLIDDLLDVAKILRGKLVIEMDPVDLVFVTESAIETVKAAAAARSIQLHAVLPQIGHISGDAARLQQVVWNLLSNAIKFTPRDGRVDILLERVVNQAQITVRDTGKGINPNFLPYLFESFRQEDASTTRKYGGLGLGLAIVRSLVEAHGGTITAESPGEGQGATFVVRFPLLDVEPDVQLPEQSPVSDLDLTGIRILAVDDEPDARELLATALIMYGAEVLTVTSAVEALTALASFQPDILVSDIGMPGVDGHSLIQQIRALPAEQGGQIPAIALTAYAREEERQRAIASGFQMQVSKPLQLDQLVRGVITLVRRLG